MQPVAVGALHDQDVGPVADRLRVANDRDIRAADIAAEHQAPELAAAQVPVFVDVLSNLPASFDQIGATLENAARLQRSGVAVSFVQRGDAMRIISLRKANSREIKHDEQALAAR